MFVCLAGVAGMHMLSAAPEPLPEYKAGDLTTLYGAKSVVLQPLDGNRYAIEVPVTVTTTTHVFGREIKTVTQYRDVRTVDAVQLGT